MEIAGSRLVIVLLIAAIGSVAYIANRDANPQSAAELAILQLDRPEANVGKPKNESASNSQKVARTIAHESTPPTPASPTGGPAIAPVKPDFDLADLVGPTANQQSTTKADSKPALDTPTNRPNPATSPVTGNQLTASTETATRPAAQGKPQGPSPVGPHTSDAMNSTNTAPADTTKQIAEPGQGFLVQQRGGNPAEPAAVGPEPSQYPNNVSTFPASAPSGGWQDDLERLGREAGSLGMPQPSDSNGNRVTSSQPNSVHENQFAKGPMTPQNTTIREPVTQTNPYSNPTSRVDDEAALRAAIDAAVNDRPMAAGGPPNGMPSPQPPTDFALPSPADTFDRGNTPPGVISTEQPAGITDWSRYLPGGRSEGGMTTPAILPPGQLNPPAGTANPYRDQSFTGGQFQIPPGYGTSGGSATGLPGPQLNSPQLTSPQLNPPQPRTAVAPGGTYPVESYPSGSYPQNQNPTTSGSLNRR
jgi:hypothetical protein